MTEYQEPGEAVLVVGHGPYDFPYEKVASAFTVAELGEMLPAEMTDTGESNSYSMTTVNCDGFWVVAYEVAGMKISEQMEAETEADARAKMLIYLLENKLYRL